MFRNKHVYSCPDVIHDRQVAKRNAIANLIGGAIFVGGLAVYGWFVDRQESKKVEEIKNLVPTE